MRISDRYAMNTAVRTNPILNGWQHEWRASAGRGRGRTACAMLLRHAIRITGGIHIGNLRSSRSKSRTTRRRRIEPVTQATEHSIVVVSGLAAGVDRAAHEAAIASGG